MFNALHKTGFSILTALAVVAIIFFSEAIYQFRNQPKNLAQLSLNLAGCSKNKNSGISIFFMDLAAYFQLRMNGKVRNAYPVTLLIAPTSRDEANSWQEYLKTSLDETRRYNYNTLLAKNFYYLGIASLKQQSIQNGYKMLRQAVTLAPEQSFLWIELANAYARNNEEGLAKTALKECGNFEDAKTYCGEYADNGLKNAIFGNPGDMSPWVEKYLSVN